MRLTKKMLREAKIGFNKRCKQLCLMNEDELKSEVKRAFPTLTFDGTHGELLNFMLHDLFDLCLPTHWHE